MSLSLFHALYARLGGVRCVPANVHFARSSKMTRRRRVLLTGLATCSLNLILFAQPVTLQRQVSARFRQLTRDSQWRLVSSLAFNFDTRHPQGLVKIGDTFFVSAVEVRQRRSGLRHRKTVSTGTPVLAPVICSRWIDRVNSSPISRWEKARSIIRAASTSTASSSGCR